MARTVETSVIGVLLLILCWTCGCQICNSTQEVRSDEAMLEVSFENERAEDLFIKAANSTYGDAKNVKRIGVPGLSVYSRNERVGCNANCNDHLRQMDTDGNLVITEREAQSHYDSITSR